MTVTRVFIHGLEGSSLGTKGQFFKAKYPEMIIEDFHGTLQQRMDKLNAMLSEENSLIIIGSSFGGLMAAVFAYENPRSVKKLVLLSPALAFSEFETHLQHKIQTPVVIYHGRKDDVVPLGSAHEIAKRVFENLDFIVLDDDHLLSKSFESIDWDNVLEANLETGSARSNMMKG